MKPSAPRLTWCECVLLMIAVMIPASAACADTPAEAFDALYGEQLKQVTATSDRDDDAALAKRLMAAAGNSKDVPKLAAEMCRHAYDLTRRHEPTTALDAMRLLGELSPNARVESQEKVVQLLMLILRTGSTSEKTAAGDELIAIHTGRADSAYQTDDLKTAIAEYRKALVIASQRRHASAGELSAKIKSTMLRQQLLRRVEHLDAILLREANHQAAAKELAMIHLLDLNQPENLAGLVGRINDETLQSRLRLAMSKESSLSTANAHDMGEWFASLAKGVSGSRAVTAQIRACRCFQRFLLLHPTEDIKRKKVELLLKQFQAKLGQLIPIDGAVAAGRKLDLLKLIVPSEDGEVGQWALNKGTLTNNRSHKATLSLPIQIGGDYRLRFAFVRHSKSGELKFTLPAGKTSTVFFIDGWRGDGGRTGLKYVDGKRLINNATTVKGFHIKGGVKQEVVIDVRPRIEKVSVLITLNGKKLVNWTGNEVQLREPGKTEAKAQPFIETGKYQFVFHHIEFTSLDGKAKLLRTTTNAATSNR